MFQNYSVSLIVPTRNEGDNLRIIIDKIPGYVDEVIVVDGNSSDDTVEIAKASQRISKVILQSSNGKGAALSAGFSEAQCDLVAIIDADGSMDPLELERFLKEFPEHQIVKGSRYLENGGSEDLTLIRSTGNRILTKFANLLFDQKWTDLAYGYAVFEKSALKELALTNYDQLGSFGRHKTYGQGFEIETLMFTRAAKRGYSVKEVASFEYNRISGTSNLNAFRDGVRVFISLLVEKLRSAPRP